ncbi:MAG: hypothetical protein HYX84_02550 [Chloroflexi bacterium]|nr:hypothetical protein [Chloroflexota bacterium]
MTAKFNPGQLVWTRGVSDLVADNAEFARFAAGSLKRHLSGDWGDVDAEDKRTNDAALNQGMRILSAYNDKRFSGHGISTIWIITEADRSATTILFPDEY